MKLKKQSHSFLSLSLILIIILASIDLFNISLLANTKNGVHYISINPATQPKYPKNFKNVDYVNPNAPINGKVVLSKLGSFDNLNPFITKGEPASELGYLYDTLMASSKDEINVSYGLLAGKIFYDEKRDWVGFQLRKEAKFSDGKPVTVDDVIWTFNTLVKKGNPFYKVYYGDVKKVEAWGKKSDRKVRFIFKKPNLELPFILGQLNVLPKHYWKNRKFEATTLDVPIGSGPYQIKNLSPGKFVEFERNKKYWANQVPIVKGEYNFSKIRVDYYRNQEVIREALKSGKVTFFIEHTAKDWALSYDISAVKDKTLKKETIKNNNPSGLQALIFNTRRDLFKNPKVREALNYAFDFEWLNKTLFFSSYLRANSYYNNSDFATPELPSADELKVLNQLKKQFPNKIPEEVFTKVFKNPTTDGSGNNRANLRKAKQLLEEAGWKIESGNLVHQKTKKKFEFEILIASPAFDRILQPFAQNLKRLGITANIKLLNPAQFITRQRQFDFDMISGGFGQSSSPGNEQFEFWGSEAASAEGSRNYIGISEPYIDEAIRLVVEAKNRKDLITRVKVLDRLLLWNHYVIPQWYYPYYRVLYWDIFSKPKIKPTNDLGFDTWWVEEVKAKKLGM